MSEKDEKTKKTAKFSSLVVPCATVFMSSFCIMVLELVAGRIIARYLGSSLYTWPPVAGCSGTKLPRATAPSRCDSSKLTTPTVHGSSGKSWFFSLSALRVKSRTHDYLGGVKGSRFPGDRADYSIEVQKPLTVSFIADGKGLNQCAPISLWVGGQPVECIRRAADKIEFGSAALLAGNILLSLAVADDAKAGNAEGEVLKVTLNLEQ